MKILPKPLKFQWDKGNIDKNKIKHKVTTDEIEEVFFDSGKKIISDKIHSGKELRYRIIGSTKDKRVLFVVFTIRGVHIRVISARDLNKREVKIYEKSF